MPQVEKTRTIPMKALKSCLPAVFILSLSPLDSKYLNPEPKMANINMILAYINTKFIKAAIMP